MTARQTQYEYIKSHLDLVLNSVTDHAILTLDLLGNITSWNEGAEKVKGYTETEILGQNFSCFYVESDKEANLPLNGLEEAAKVGRYETQGWRVRKNGEVFWADVVIQPLKTPGGEAIGFVKITRDITEKHHLGRLTEEYYKLKSHEMVGQLSGGIAHDFNNLLTVIEAGHELIANYVGDMRVDRILDVNKVAVDKTRKLIAQLLAFSRRQILRPVPTDINEAILVFDALIERAVGEALSVRWLMGKNLPRVNVDGAQLQSAVLNLIVNARDATSETGIIKIATELKHLNYANPDAADELPAGTYVVVSVSDSGKGMNKDIAARAIEPFFTTKDVGKGTGLGLSQCYGFAKQSGGSLSIESLEDVGTTVRIYLPALTGDEQAAHTPKQRTILLVDDESAIRSLVGEMLRSLGHTVIEAEDAREALQKLKTDLSIDYLFTDIIMPNGMNGLELLDEARAMRPGLPALLASGYPREVLRNIADLRDDIMVLQKPYTLEVLANNIGRTRE